MAKATKKKQEFYYVTMDPINAFAINDGNVESGLAEAKSAAEGIYRDDHDSTPTIYRLVPMLSLVKPKPTFKAIKD